MSVLHEDNSRLYNELVHDKFDNKEIYLFNTHDDVLDMLEEGVLGTVGENERAQGWWCRDRWAERKEDKFNYTTPYSGGLRYHVKAKHVYQKAGIYFSIIAKLKYMRQRRGQWLWTALPTDITLSYSYQYTRRCRGAVNQNPTTVSVAEMRKLSRRHYSGIRALKNYEVTSTFTYLSKYDNTAYQIELDDIRD